MTDLTPLRKSVDKKLVEYGAARLRYRQTNESLEQTQGELQDTKDAQAIAQEVAQQVQEEAHRKIADVVSRSLEAVFDEPYTFKIKFEQKRGRTEASLVFVRGDLEVDPMTASGGGVVDLAAFALRLSCLLLAKPPLRRLLVLDEPFRFISAEFRPRVRALLLKLAEEMGVQVVMVTHQEEMRCGKILEL